MDIQKKNKTIWVNRKIEGKISSGRVYSKVQGIDYFDTYSLVTKITTIRALIALAAIYNLLIHQMDVKIVFLYDSTRRIQISWLRKQSMQT